MVRFFAFALTALLCGSSLAQQKTARFEVAIVDCPGIDRAALARFLRLELSTEVAVVAVHALGPVDGARVQVTCSGRNVWLNVRPPQPAAKAVQAFRTLPEQALNERGGERLLALAIAEMLVANAVEHHLAPPPAHDGSPARPRQATQAKAEAKKETKKEVIKTKTKLDTEAKAESRTRAAAETRATTPTQSLPPPPQPREPGLRVGVSGHAVTVPIQFGPSWFGGRVWASALLSSSIAIEVAGGYMLGAQDSDPGAIHSDVTSAHLNFRYLVRTKSTIIDMGLGGMVSYMHFDGIPKNPPDPSNKMGYIVRERGFVNGGPSVQLRIATQTQPLFAGLSVEAAMLLQPVKMLTEPNIVVSNIRGFWLGLALDLGGIL